MKKTLLWIAALVLSVTGLTQPTIKGSIQPGSGANEVEVSFLPNYTSAMGEYITYLSISVAIPTSLASGVSNPSITGIGNLAGVTFVKATPFSYTTGTETIYSWISNNLTVQSMAWTNGTRFPGATIGFTGGNVSSKVRLVDFSNDFGGGYGNTLFSVVTNVAPFDVTDFSDFFFSIPGINTEGVYPSGDQFIETNSLISLPVSLVSFSGYKEGNQNILQWTTVSEVNSKGFDVQRSADGVNYSSIGFVKSRGLDGNSTVSLGYTFNDNFPTGEKQYYRLSQLDIDGRSKMSSIILVKGEKPRKLAIKQLFPNPGLSFINVIVDAPLQNELSVVIYDLAGKALKQQVVKVETGSNTIVVDLNGLTRGSYMIKAFEKSGGESVMSKFVKQ
jgi:hypothetical protein